MEWWAWILIGVGTMILGGVLIYLFLQWLSKDINKGGDACAFPGKL